MRRNKLPARPFIPTDIRRAALRIRTTWTKLTDREVSYYLDGRRDKLVAALQRKYSFSNQEQAELTLSNLERLV